MSAFLSLGKLAVLLDVEGTALQSGNLRRPETEATAPGRRDGAWHHMRRHRRGATRDTVPCLPLLWHGGDVAVSQVEARSAPARQTMGLMWPHAKQPAPCIADTAAPGAAALSTLLMHLQAPRGMPEKQLKPCTIDVSHPLKLHVVPVLLLLGLLLLQRGNLLVELIYADAINVWRCCSFLLFACSILQAMACTVPCTEACQAGAACIGCRAALQSTQMTCLGFWFCLGSHLECAA